MATWTEGGLNGVLNSTTEVELVPAPAAATRRIVRSVTVYNNDTALVTLHLYLKHVAAEQTIQKVSLDPGDTFYFDETLVMDAVDLSVCAKLLAAAAANQPIFTSSWGDATS